MLLLFLDAHGMILQHWVPRGQTVNGDYYAKVLKTHLRGAMRKKSPDFLKNSGFCSRIMPATYCCCGIGSTD